MDSRDATARAFGDYVPEAKPTEEPSSEASAHAPVPVRDEASTGRRAGVQPCWSCHGPVGRAKVFCSACHAVQPPGQLDHYERLGLQIDFDVDLDHVEQAYFDAQRLLHPDRFATKSSKERALSQSQATAINEAYETLKDPLRRADYTVHLMGAGVLQEGCDLINDQALLMETMEMREALAEAETVEDVNALARRAKNDINDCVGDVSDAFKAKDIEQVGHLVTRLKYLYKLAEETRTHRRRLLADG